jgi:hypothetical protein
MSNTHKTIDYISGGMSVLGCSCMLLSYFRFQKLRNTFGQYSMWFAICGIGNFLYPALGSPPDGSAICIIQSMIGLYFVLVSMLTSTIIIHGISEIFNNSSAKLKITHGKILYAWGLPFIFSVIPMFTNSYKSTGTM